MIQPKSSSRRQWLKTGLAALVSAAAGSVLARTTALTPSQGEGPFYPDILPAEDDTDLTWIQGHAQRAQGDPIRIEGQVLDEQGKPIPDALVEIWQANAAGRYHHDRDPNPAARDPDFQGWGRTLSDANGRYAFTTIFPGAYPVSERWWRPPHIHFKIARRGYRELTTQLYFAGQPLNDKDRLLMELPEPERARLIVTLQSHQATQPRVSRVGHFDIVLAPV